MVPKWWIRQEFHGGIGKPLNRLKIRSRFAITLRWMVIGIFTEHRGKSWNYISTIYFSSFFLFFFTVMWIRYYGKERKTNQIDNHYRPLILQNWSMNNLFFRDLFKIPQIQFDTWNIVSIVYHWVDTLS